MKKRLIVVLAVLATVVGIAFAQNDAQCTKYGLGNGLYGNVVSSTKTPKKDPTVAEYENKVEIYSSSASKIFVTKVTIKNSRGGKKTVNPYVTLEPYGSIVLDVHSVEYSLKEVTEIIGQKCE